ncbi:hypothetical protein XaC1_258 [Xanthomonas phage XaC1]|nr:hypothetical protein XaC1_258 [Xanthomonas phage XaC1]
MILVLEENWGVSDQGTDDYIFPEYSDSESSWYDRLKKFIGDILFGS